MPQEIQEHKLKILEIRHKVGAHSGQYKTFDDSQNKKECYAPIRMTMGDKTFELSNMYTDSSEKIDLEVLINEYLEKIFKITENLVNKFISTIFKDNEDKKEEQLKILDLIKKQIKGEVIIFK